MNNNSLYNFIYNHVKNNPISFHMPGHKGRDLFKKYGIADMKHLLPCGDITEIPGADNLFSPEDTILSGQNAYSKLYGSKKTFYSVNGSSAALMAAIFSSCSNGGKAIVARNCHRAVFNAVRLWNIVPIYAFPDEITTLGSRVTGGEIESLLLKNPDTEAVVITSPDYYGNCCDIKTISDTVHSHGAYLIVDEAHGAHLTLFHKNTDNPAILSNSCRLPGGAVEQGADFVINSTHKTLASFTQSAVLNVATDKIPDEVLLDRLQLLESSSPSYLLMLSLELNAVLLENEGNNIFSNWLKDLNNFYERVRNIEKVFVYIPEALYDFTKINLAIGGLSGAEVSLRLNEYGIFPELDSGNFTMMMSGIGNIRSDYEHLLKSVADISKTASKPVLPEPVDSIYLNHPEYRAIPKRAVPVHYSKSSGHVSALSIVPYPPGIPLLCPGEIITQNTVETIKKLIAKPTFISGIDTNGMIFTDGGKTG